jgi:hypothetical protein
MLAESRKNTLFCCGAFYFFSFCRTIVFAVEVSTEPPLICCLPGLTKTRQPANFTHLLPPHEQPLWAKRKKVKCAAAKKEDFFGQTQLAHLQLLGR